MARWLMTHGFEEVPAKAGGHAYYKKEGVKITLPAHGPQDLTKKVVGHIMRTLEQLGFDKTEIRKELGGG
jgi:predicted RNA binding protein YcfA (HicA-like mRNA interferase family)